MTATDRGRVVDVTTRVAGDELAVDAPVGTLVLTLGDVADFGDDEGGRLTIGPAGDEYTWLEIDDDLSTITLEVALVAAYVVGDRVELAPRTEWVEASVSAGEGDPLVCEVPHALADRLVDGVREPIEGETVAIEEVAPGEWVVTDVLGTPLRVDGGYLLPGTVPAAASLDGLPPATAPTVTLVPGIGSLFFRWTEVANADPVTYRLYVSDVSPVATTTANLAAAGVGLTMAAVRKLPTGVALDPSGATTYYAVVVASDGDGAGPTSVQVSGAPAQVTGPDIAVGAVTTALLVANNVLADAVDASDMTAVTLTGTTIQSSAAENTGVKIDTAGIRAYDPLLAPFFVVDLLQGVTIVNGTSKLSTLTVADGTSLGGVTEVTRSTDGTAGALRLTAGTTAPKSAPTAIVGYDQQQFTDDGLWSNRHGWSTDGTYWYTVREEPGSTTFRVEQWNATGTLAAQSASFGRSVTYTSCAVGGGKLWVLYLLDSSWTVSTFSLTTLNADARFFVWNNADGNRRPVIGWDAADATNPILIAQSRASDDQVVIRRYPIPPGDASTGLVQASSNTHNDSTYPYHLSTLLAGTFDIGAPRFVFSSGGGHIFRGVQQSNGNYPTGDPDSWVSGMQNKVGCDWDGTRFRSIDKDGVQRTYTGIREPVAANRTKWVSNTVRNTTYETNQSPRAKIVLPNRAKLTVTTSPINTGTGGVDNPDRVRVYVGQGATDPGRPQMARQGTDPAVGVTTVAYSTLTAPPGTNPPAANGFPNSVMQRLERGDGGVLFDGSGALGAAGQSAVDTQIAVGRKVGTFTGTTDASGNITITHNLGVVPSSVAVTGRAPRGFYRVLTLSPGVPTSTTMGVDCVQTNGTTQPAGVTITVDWQVYK